MKNDSPKPRLSLVFAARNDNYMGNFNWRIETVLNYLAHNLTQLDRLDEVEVVVSDWGSEEPLQTVLNLTPAAQKMMRFIVTPPKISQQIGEDSEFPIVFAQNVGVRHAKGEYIGQVDSDIIFTPQLVEITLDILSGQYTLPIPPDKALLFTKRRHIPWRYVASTPPIHELHWFIHRFGRFLPVETFFGFEFAGPGYMIMHRRLWEECRGYDEKLIYRGWMEIDLGLRVRQKYPLFNLQKIGLTAFHLEHFPTRTNYTNPRKFNETVWPTTFCPNDEDWGLGQYDLEQFTYSVSEPTSPLSLSQPVRTDRRMLSYIIPVILNSFWHPIQHRLGLIKLLTSRFFFHLGAIWNLLKGKSPTQWPNIVKGWWLKRQQRF